MRLWPRLLAFLALFCPLAVQAQNSIVVRLDAKEKQLENLYAEYWRTEYQIAVGNEHLSSRPIQEKIRAVTSDDKFLHDLKATHVRDRLLNRRRNLFLEEATYTETSNDTKLTALVEEITRGENAMRYKVGDRQLTRAELTELAVHSSDRRLRQQAWEARAQILSTNGEHIRKAFKLRNELALQHTDELFSTFMLRRKGVETQRLFEWFDNIRSQTEPEYQQSSRSTRWNPGTSSTTFRRKPTISNKAGSFRITLGRKPSN